MPALLVANLWLAAAGAPAQEAAVPQEWAREWPETDFTRSSVDFAEIRSGGPPRDGIPALSEPRFVPLEAVEDLPGNEPVIVVTGTAEARAYPLRVLMWHEIVNDILERRPLVITYCPLCNASAVYDRRVRMTGGEPRVLEFGVSGSCAIRT